MVLFGRLTPLIACDKIGGVEDPDLPTSERGNGLSSTISHPVTLDGWANTPGSYRKTPGGPPRTRGTRATARSDGGKPPSTWGYAVRSVGERAYRLRA